MFRRTKAVSDIDLSHEETEELISLLATRPEVPFPKLDGLAIGLSITGSPPLTDIPGLLAINDASPELLVLINRYAQSVQNTLDDDLLAPRLENVENLTAFGHWLEGLGLAVSLAPDRTVPLLTSGPREIRSMLHVVMAFSPVWPNTPKSQIRGQRAARNEYLKGFADETADDLLQRSYSLVAGLMDAYGNAPLLSSDNAGADHTVRRTEPKTGPNEPCPCGSGKKYKKCHGVPGRV
ncbi:SEC-C metal-binding domain-containing protein (plasmid) [Deinococcus radiomollis]